MNTSDKDLEKPEEEDTDLGDSPEGEIDPIEDFLKSLSPGQTIMVTRSRPSEYRGFLEEISVIDSDESPIDITGLIKKWGGHQLTLQVRHRNGVMGACYSIPLFTFPPMIYGQRLEPVNPFQRQIDKSLELSQRLTAPVQNQNQNLETLTAMMTVLQTAQSSQIGMFKEILKRDMPSVQNQPVSQIDGIKDLFQMFSMFQAMITRTAPPTPAPSSDFGELGSLMPLITQLLGGKGNKKPVLTAPQPQSVDNAILPVTNSSSIPNPEFQPNIDELATLIAQSGPKASAAVAAKIFGSLRQEERESAIDSFFTLANIDIEDEDEDKSPK